MVSQMQRIFRHPSARTFSVVDYQHMGRTFSRISEAAEVFSAIRGQADGRKPLVGQFFSVGESIFFTVGDKVVKGKDLVSKGGWSPVRDVEGDLLAFVNRFNYAPAPVLELLRQGELSGGSLASFALKHKVALKLNAKTRSDVARRLFLFGRLAMRK